MAAYFLDTSALAKYYHDEVGTPELEETLSSDSSDFYISSLSVVEIRSVLAKKVREGFITADQFDIQRKKFFADLTTGVFKSVRTTGVHFQLAGTLIENHGKRLAIRTLDAIQLGVILQLKDAIGIDIVVCSDKKFIPLIQAEGLLVFNPETP